MTIRFRFLAAAVAGQLFLSPALGQQASTEKVPVPQLVVEGARKEAAKATPYIMEYEVLKYPGDVAEGTGVCTDLVIRALRNAGIDLQKEVHKDRLARPSAYSQLWDKKAIDKNIDHRRCPNLVTWFRKHAQELSIKTDSTVALEDWRGGDIVFYVHKGATHPWHVGIVSDRRDADGMPLIIDSYPPHTTDTHRLDEFAAIHSHFRLR